MATTFNLREAAESGSLTDIEAAWECGSVTPDTIRAEAAVIDHSSLHHAASEGHYSLCAWLLDHGAVITAQDRNLCIPLTRAAASGHADIVELLLSRGSPIDSLDVTGCTPLIDAVYSSRTSVLRVLLEHGASVAAKTHSGRTPLHFAQQAAVAMLLLQYGADVHARMDAGDTPLDVVQLHLGRNAVQPALVAYGASVAKLRPRHVRDYLHEYMVAVAEGAWCRRVAAVVWLWCGCDIADMAAPTSTCNLHRAVIRPSQMKRMNAAWARGEIRDIDAKDEEGYTPLIRAIMAKTLPSIKWLLERGADPDVQFSTASPLHYAVSAKWTECVDLLLQVGACSNAMTNSRHAPLRLAMVRSHDDIVTLLLENGADVHVRDEAGRTLLQECTSMRLGLGPLLVAYGASLDEADHDDIARFLWWYLDAVANCAWRRRVAAVVWWFAHHPITPRPTVLTTVTS